MADAQDNTDKERKTVGKGPAIAFSLVLILVGLGLAAFPLIWWELQAQPNTAISAATYPVFHWIGLCFLVAGLSVMIGKLIVFDAVGAGKAKFAGFELPVQIGGTAFLFMFLMLGFSFISERYDLANVQARSQALVDQRQTAIDQAVLSALEDAAATAGEAALQIQKDHEEQMTTLQASLREMEETLMIAQTQRTTYRHVLLNQLENESGVELLRLRFDCGEDQGMQWIDWALPDDDGDDVVESLHPGESGRQGSDVHALTFDRGGNLEFVIRTARRDPVMHTTLEFYKDSFILATIRPRDASLQEYCNTLHEHESDTLLTSHTTDVRSTALELSNE